MIVFLLMNLMVGVSAFLLNYRILKFANFIDAFLSFFILYFAQIISTQLILGIFGILYLHNVIFLNCAILLTIWLITRNKKSYFNFFDVENSLSELLNNKIILLAVSLILGFGLVKIFINLINPPFGWDNLSYHFVFPVEWLKHGNLDNPITLCDDTGPSYYPINGSLFFLWFMLPLRNLFLADLGQFPFFVLAFISLYGISRRLGLNRELSFYSSTLFIITPNVFKQLEIAYVDVMFAALFFTCVYFLLSLYEDFSLKSLVLWSISFAIFLGTKSSAIIYGVFPSLFFVYALIRNRKKINFNKIVIYFLLFIVFMVLLGGFTYIRNFIQTGNPLYPAEIELFGRKVIKGVVPFSFYRAHWTQEDFNLEKLLFHEGMGVQFILLAIPGIFLSIFLTLKKRSKDINSALVFILSLPIFLYLSFWFFMPQFWVRYLYPFLGMSFVVAMYAGGLLNIPLKVLRVIVFICLMASVGELSGHSELVVSIILSVLFFIFLTHILKLKFNLKFNLIIFILITVILQYLNFNYNKHEFDRYLSNTPFLKADRQAWKWLNDNNRGSRVAYTGAPLVLPLYGNNFKNDVLYISINKTYPIKLHYFPNAKYIWLKDYMAFHKSLEKSNNYRENPNYSIWLSNLRSENIDYLVVYSLHMLKEPVFPLENEWARQHPEVFNLAYKDNTIHIYRIIR